MTWSASEDRGSVAYIIGTYPLLTTTFIDREIELLRRDGLDVMVISLRRPHGRLSPAQQPLVGDVHYVLPVTVTALLRSQLGFLVSKPVTLLRTLTYLVSRPHRSVRSRLRTVLHFGEGVHVAHLLRGNPDLRHLHAHFVDRAATVALVAGRLLGLPFSATAHANDIYVNPVLLPEKLSRAEFVVTCTEYNAAHLASIGASRPDREIVCIHHGLDLERYEPQLRKRRAEKPVILAVGQLKEKKGFSDLVEACHTLRHQGYDFACRIVGDGPLRAELEAQIRRHSLENTVILCGALGHDEVLEHYRAATVFALPCITAADGDRDGIPNVIIEAMAMELPVISTLHSGIPEAVRDGWTGVLVAPQDPPSLTIALARLLDDPDTCKRMGRRGRQVVAEKFDVATNAKALLTRFGQGMA